MVDLGSSEAQEPLPERRWSAQGRSLLLPTARTSASRGPHGFRYPVRQKQTVYRRRPRIRRAFAWHLLPCPVNLRLSQRRLRPRNMRLKVRVRSRDQGTRSMPAAPANPTVAADSSRLPAGWPDEARGAFVSREGHSTLDLSFEDRCSPDCFAWKASEIALRLAGD